MKISFDYDGTLDHPSIQKYCVEQQELGHDIYIVTTRMSVPEESTFDIFETAEKLSIPHHKIYFTDMEWKYKTLLELGIDIHVDDCKEEMKLIKKYSSIQTIFSQHLKQIT